MECEFCGGNMREEIVTYTGKAKSAVIVVKNIKAYECSQCGEEMYEESEAELISKIAEKITECQFELAIADANKWR